MYLMEMIRSARTVDELKGRIGNRYHKVNLEAYSRHKTVEFRQHSGTTNFTKCVTGCCFSTNWLPLPQGSSTRGDRAPGHPSFLTMNRSYIIN